MEQIENILVGEATNTGRKRENNEDNYLVVDASRKGADTDLFGYLFAVADGMGGHVAGETASRMACDALMRYYDREYEPMGVNEPEILLERIEKVIRDTHREILAYAEEHEECDGMGTTLSVLVLLDNKALIGHVGDSRVLRLRADRLEQLTVDHTEVQALIDMGRLKPERAATHPRRHILTQAIGVEDALEQIFTRIAKVNPGDVFLLCSDGLHDMVADDDIRQIIVANPAPQASCNRLVEMALENGGEDNVTVIVVRV